MAQVNTTLGLLQVKESAEEVRQRITDNQSQGDPLIALTVTGGPPIPGIHTSHGTIGDLELPFTFININHIVWFE